MTTAMIADDEAPLLKYMQSMLAKCWPELSIVATANNGEQAVEVIKKYQPNIAFLDINMPGLTGLEVAQKCNAQCHIVFVTAYVQYAVEAFEAQAVDYLLKPVEQNRLEQTIERLKSKLQNTPTDLNQIVMQLMEQKQPPVKKLKWLKVHKGDEVILVDINDIHYFQSADKYTSVYTKEKEYIVRTSLKNLETQLDRDVFWRIHRSTIIKVTSIAKVSKDISGQLLVSLKGRKRLLPVSRAHLGLFK